ncbi:MAG: hypothetical protein DRJ01_15830 [Bacteroidetes bacterium]|nr:MAG: hypothetical protein DRJ01_15830 [Bacteroidota bacterium]
MMILIAKLYNKKKDYKQSINFGKKALKISKENGLLEQQQKSCFLLSDNYLILKEYKKSLESFKQYNIIQSSIFNKKIAKTISDLEVRHATEKEKKENEILKKDKAILELKFKILIIILFFGILLIILLYIRYCEKVKLNQQIEKQKEELRIVNLKQEELLEQLEKLNATKNKFFSIIAHDLKNSFHALLAGSRLLSVDIDNLDKKLIKTLGRELKISADNLYKLLDNLLKWARVQIDVIQYAPTKIQLSEIIEENFNLLNGKSIDKKIDMISEVDRNIFVYADRNMLNSVLQNLVFNALKFTHPGGKITINSIKKDDYIQVDVKDSGIGISEKTINKLFKIDIHISTPGTANEKGTGLGLILCKEFIEKNGGKIWIKSEFGKGSIFSFTLPAFSEENKKINSA